MQGSIALTIVNVVIFKVRILRIIDDQRSAQSIAVLSVRMAVVPIRARVGKVESVQE
jgi:hypothetical protein